MANLVEAPLSMIESVADLRFPRRTDRRLPSLMDRNHEGDLSEDETDEREALVELRQTIALARAQTLRTGFGPDAG